MPRRIVLNLALSALAFGASLTLPLAADRDEVDLALIMAIDVSYSVDLNEHRLQMEGLANALASEAVMEAIKSGPKQKIALAIFQWSDESNQRVIVPWTIISGPAEIEPVVRFIGKSPRLVSEGGTAISAALTFGAAQFWDAPRSERRTIDLSTDGRNNMGVPTPVARDAVLKRGIVINGLAISNEWEHLERYLERQVIGGAGAFVESATNYDDYGAAMQRKLVKEIVGPGLT